MAALIRRRRLRGAVRLALATFALCVAGLAAMAWLAGEGSELAMEYEGFD